MKKILTTTIIFGLIVGFAVIISQGIDKTLVVECNGWVEEYNENRNNPGYYWTGWQVEQCEEVIDYKFDGTVIKK